MKLYRAKIPVIAHEVVKTLTTDGDIEVEGENLEEAERDLQAIMEEFVRRDMDFRNRIKDHMSHRRIPYGEYGRVRSAMAEESGHPLGDDIERFLCRQFIENMMISRFVEEVWSEDKELHRKIMDILRDNDVNEAEIREEAMSKVKNVREGTVDYEIALRNAMRDVKKRRGLI